MNVTSVFDSDIAAARYIVKAASVGERKVVWRNELDNEARELFAGRTAQQVIREAMRRAGENKTRVEMIGEAARFLRFTA